MSAARKKLLDRRVQARDKLKDPDLPPAVKDLYKQALDSTETALGLQDAQAFKLQKLGQAPGEPVPPDPEPLASAGPTGKPQVPVQPTLSASATPNL